MAGVPSLSDEQKEFFATNGFLILRHILSPEEQAALIAWTAEVKAWPDTPGKWMPYLEIDSRGAKVTSRVENYANYHPGFGGLLRGDTVTGILAQLSGEKMWLMKEKINYKLAHAGGFDAHIDAVAYTAVKAKQPVELETGEFLVFGSHLAHRSGPNNSDLGRAAIYATYGSPSILSVLMAS
ncbi:hypothetical protein RQP46_001921 [Phenoliferia psychrophenolica]